VFGDVSSVDRAVGSRGIAKPPPRSICRGRHSGKRVASSPTLAPMCRAYGCQNWRSVVCREAWACTPRILTWASRVASARHWVISSLGIPAR
jgi:hypothetical protein